MLGFMVSQDFHYPQILHSPLTSVMSNLAGDPFTTTKPHPHSSKWIERNVLDYFASLWNAKWPHDPSDPESYWGYVLTMGSTEGNMHALWSARNYLTVESIYSWRSKYASRSLFLTKHQLQPQ
jgi:histidine decarboxylase